MSSSPHSERTYAVLALDPRGTMCVSTNRGGTALTARLTTPGVWS